MADENLTYEQMLDIVANYYNTDADSVVQKLNEYNIPYGDMEQLYNLIDSSAYTAKYNADGSIRSFNYEYTQNAPSNAAQEAASNINSNVAVKDKIKIEMPMETKIDPVTKYLQSSNGLQSLKEAAKHPAKFTATSVVPAIAAAATGISLGKQIDSALYNANPDFWDEKGMSSLNPETWNSITSEDDSTGAHLFNMVFGLNPDDGTSQAYIDENALAYLALYMQNSGIFDSTTLSEVESGQNVGGKQINGTIIKKTTAYSKALASNLPNNLCTDFVRYSNNEKINAWCLYARNPDNSSPIYFMNKENETIVAFPENVSDADGQWECNLLNNNVTGVGSVRKRNYTFDNKTVDYYLFTGSVPIINVSTLQDNYDDSLLAWIMVYGKASEISGVEGIDTQPDATTPDLSGLNDIADVLKKLKEQYPNLWDNAVSQDVAQPDGSTKTYVYVPVGFPNVTGATDTQPTTGNQTQNNTKINPSTAPAELTQALTQTATKTLTTTDTPNPPNSGTGKGETPAVVPPVGKASSLYAIYNPSLSQINDFGSWLWSDNFVDQIKKLFNDPMQAIIGLHKVYATPATSGTGNIKVGYLDSGVSSKLVSEQYTTVNCGTVSLSEYFGNVFDYSPYTEVQLYLPFIGIVNLDTADVMRSKITVTYHVDVLTGACLAEVKVIRDAAGGTLYQYAGNAAVTLPISSGSYMGIVASIASIAGGVAGTIASGGAAAPMLIGAAGSALNARTKVEHSGGFSGNAGAMGIKIPYLIISRPQSVLASNYQDFVGNPSNETVVLSSCSGYIKVKEVHLENIPATEDELTQIENSLKEGVLL